MTLGTSRPRNWGIEAQSAALGLLMSQRNVGYNVRTIKNGRTFLQLYKQRDNMKLPVEWECELENVGRGRWISTSSNDGAEIAQGCSQRDVIRATIQKVWQ